MINLSRPLENGRKIRGFFTGNAEGYFLGMEFVSISGEPRRDKNKITFVIICLRNFPEAHDKTMSPAECFAFLKAFLEWRRALFETATKNLSELSGRLLRSAHSLSFSRPCAVDHKSSGPGFGYISLFEFFTQKLVPSEKMITHKLPT